MPRVQYVIVKDEPGQPLVIRDSGPWNTHMTITNAAEAVVAELVASGLLANNRRLLYYDSEGLLDEIVIQDGEFAGFQPVKGDGDESD